MLADIRIYDAETIDALPWENFQEGKAIRNFLQPLIKDGVKQYIDNIHTKMLALTIGDYILPVTVNDEEYLNSYVCSPFGH